MLYIPAWQHNRSASLVGGGSLAWRPTNSVTHNGCSRADVSSRSRAAAMRSTTDVPANQIGHVACFAPVGNRHSDKMWNEHFERNLPAGDGPHAAPGIQLLWCNAVIAFAYVGLYWM